MTNNNYIILALFFLLNIMSFKKQRGSIDSYKPSSLIINSSSSINNRINRKNNQFREIKYEYDLIPNASGSIYAQYGKTKLIVAIYGPKQLRNNKLSNNNIGKFKCYFHYSPFAFHQRLNNNKLLLIKEKDMALNIEKSLKNVILLNKYPKCIIEAHVWLLQCDGNILSCSINTISLTLNYCKIEMFDFITSTKIIIINNNILIDPILSEERNINKQCEIIISFMNQKKQITLLNMNGSLSSNKTKEILQLSFKGCLQLKHLMKASLFKQFQFKLISS